MLILKILIYIFLTFSSFVILYDIRSLIISKNYYKNCEKVNNLIKEQDSRKIEMIVILPCLREQNIIIDSINYFRAMDLTHTNMHLIIACTKRELINNNKYGFDKSSAEVARSYIDTLEKEKNISYFVYEAEDYDNGDRATQMNMAVEAYLNKCNNIDIIAVFDADSRPDLLTFEEVAYRYKRNPNNVYQQPENYLPSAFQCQKENKSSLVIANALYQHEWTVLTEIPLLVNYSKNPSKYRGFFCMNGHGMFFPLSIYKKIKFPEHEVTDGTHIGYRVGMSSTPAEPLLTQGKTDAPHNLKSLPQQHKRWFGGSVRLLSCRKWCKKNNIKPKDSMVFTGFLYQIRWAVTVNCYIFSFISSIIIMAFTNNFIPLLMLLISMVIYCYIYSYISYKLAKREEHIKTINFLFIPFAMIMKSIGPDLFILQKLFRRKVEFRKCER